MKPEKIWARAAQWAEVGLDIHQIEQLRVFAGWLADEALVTGAIGPREANRIDRRHIGDSILFAQPMKAPERIVDFGSGAGLPGVPLAILYPNTEVILIDRSERKTELLRRVVRILRIENIEVVTGEIGALPASVPVLVSRAVFRPERALRALGPRLGSGGRLVIGGSWTERPASNGWEVVEVPETILDHKVWLLMMRAP